MGTCASFTPPVPAELNPRGVVVATPIANNNEIESTLSVEITEQEWVQNLSVGEIPMYIVLGNQNSDCLWSLSPETMFNLYPKLVINRSVTTILMSSVILIFIFILQSTVTESSLFVIWKHL